MSRKGNCHDNAGAESFFSLLRGSGQDMKSRIISNLEMSRKSRAYQLFLLHSHSNMEANGML